MKKMGLVLGALIVVAIVVLAIKGNDMHEIRTEIEIAAPPEKVWSIVSNVEGWPEWSPIINAAKGTANTGAKLDITMAGENGKDGPKYAPVVTDFEDSKYFRWRAKMMAGFIFTNDKVFELEQTASGTKLVHIERFKGLMLPLMCSQLDKGVPPMLNSMNEALKKLAETN